MLNIPAIRQCINVNALTCLACSMFFYCLQNLSVGFIKLIKRNQIVTAIVGIDRHKLFFDSALEAANNLLSAVLQMINTIVKKHYANNLFFCVCVNRGANFACFAEKEQPIWLAICGAGLGFCFARLY